MVHMTGIIVNIMVCINVNWQLALTFHTKHINRLTISIYIYIYIYFVSLFVYKYTSLFSLTLNTFTG